MEFYTVSFFFVRIFKDILRFCRDNISQINLKNTPFSRPALQGNFSIHHFCELFCYGKSQAGSSVSGMTLAFTLFKGFKYKPLFLFRYPCACIFYQKRKILVLFISIR